MKKKGFTLAEMVVAITVVGAVAAASVPLINSIIPDRKKIAVLKVHKQITSINQNLLTNPSIYYDDNNCDGLACTAAPLNWTPRINGVTANQAVGNVKYLILLADSLNASNLNIDAGTFTTIDNIAWTVNGFDITIDIENGGNDCLFSNACQNPDTFRFSTDTNNGNVSGLDPLTITYLANPHRLNNRAEDYKNASK